MDFDFENEAETLNDQLRALRNLKKTTIADSEALIAQALRRAYDLGRQEECELRKHFVSDTMRSSERG